MALYVSAGQRRRVVVVVGVAALILGVVAGFAIGRGTATSIDDSVESARRAGRTFASSLRVLPLEYEQVSAGNEGRTSSAEDIVSRVLDREEQAIAAAPWLNKAATAQLDGYLKVLTDAPANDLPPAEFEAAVDKAAAEVERLFGIGATASPG